jgi:DNA polymerase III subunit gamma/tau
MRVLRKKKELLAKQQGFTPKTVEEKNEKFNETQLHAAWDDYIHRLKNKGEKILASIMETDMPKLRWNYVITIELACRYYEEGSGERHESSNGLI